MALDNYSDRFAHVSGSYTFSTSPSTAFKEIIPRTDVKMAERITMQFVNEAAGAHKVKVYGTCRMGAGTVGGYPTPSGPSPVVPISPAGSPNNNTTNPGNYLSMRLYPEYQLVGQLVLGVVL